MPFVLKPALEGAWSAGRNDSIAWIQFLGPAGRPEFTVQRKLHCLNVGYIVHKIPPEMGCDLIVPYSFQDYSAEEFVSCDGRGFLISDGVGGSAFRTGSNDFDNDYTCDLNVIERIVDKFCFVVIEKEYILPVTSQTKATMRQFCAAHQLPSDVECS